MGMLVSLCWHLCSIFTVLAAFTDAQLCASHPALVAFTVLFETSTFLAMASFSMEPFFRLDFRFESIWVSIYDGFDSCLPFLIIFNVCAIHAVAFRPTPLSVSEAVTIQLQALGLFAIASVSSSSALHCWILHPLFGIRWVRSLNINSCLRRLKQVSWCFLLLLNHLWFLLFLSTSLLVSNDNLLTASL